MLDGFCEYLRRQGKSENTVKAYCQGMKEYMRWHEETFGKRMKMFLRANVLDYISYLRTVKGLSNRSVNAKLASLHSFNLYLIAAGYTKEVVLDKQDYLKVQLAYASPSTVSREEVERFRQEILEHCGIRDYAIVTILAYAGLRISECLALRVEDISLPAREIKVRHGKGDKMRVVYFGDKVVNAVGVPQEPAEDGKSLSVPRAGRQPPDPEPGQPDLQRVFRVHHPAHPPPLLLLQCPGEWIHHCRSGKPGGPLQCPHHTALHQPHPGEDEGEGEPPLSDLSVLYIIR